MLETNEQTNRWEKKRIGSNYIGQAADRCLFTGAIPLLIDTGTFAAAFPPWVFTSLLRQPGHTELPRCAHIDTDLSADAAQHRSLDSRTPALTPSTNSGLQVAGSQEHATTPNR